MLWSASKGSNEGQDDCERKEKNDRIKTELWRFPLPHPQTLFSSSSDLLGGDGRWTDVEKAQDKEAFKAVNVKLPQLLSLKKKQVEMWTKRNECNRKREIW